MKQRLLSQPLSGFQKDTRALASLRESEAGEPGETHKKPFPFVVPRYANTMRDNMGPEVILRRSLESAIGKNAKGVDFSVEAPENLVHGDYATNVALKLAPALQQPPMKIAEEFAERLRNSEIEKFIERIEVAPPGFINFFLSVNWLQKQIAAIAIDKAYGLQPAAYSKRKKLQIEFISANPTGPLTLANGRGGFLGDCLANILEAAGCDVVREYYVNDTGEQIKKLGASVCVQWGFSTSYQPDELYRGAYIQELAKMLSRFQPKEDSKFNIPAGGEARHGRQYSEFIDTIAREASKLMLKDIKRVARKAGIRFDSWFSEQSLYRQGFVDDTLKTLKRKNLVRERDGAQWLMLSSLSEPRVVVKASGEPTYVLPDLAYHIEKFSRRKFDRVIDILGADHHGHAKVLSAALAALGYPAPHVILMQFVRLVENGREAKMSKRTGTFVTLEELLEEVGVDVARWFFVERAPQTHMEFDLSLAKERSEKNPVFYVQYAHARCSAILRKAEPAKSRKKERELTRKNSLKHPSEISLMKELVRSPDVVARIARTYEVHQLPPYATAVATAFSAFYRDCPVLTANSEMREERLQLVRATQIVLANSLRLMGIRAPETM